MYLKAQTVWRHPSNSSDFITQGRILKAMPELTNTAVRADLWINYFEDPATTLRWSVITCLVFNCWLSLIRKELGLCSKITL